MPATVAQYQRFAGPGFRGHSTSRAATQEYRWQPLSQPREHPGNCLVQRRAAFAHDFTVFGQQPPQTVHLHRSKFDLLLTHSLQRERGPLGSGLYCDCFTGHLRSHPDRACAGSFLLPSTKALRTSPA
jgi:hypothetical protein